MFSHYKSGGTGVTPGKGKQPRGVDIINYDSTSRSKATAQKQFRSEFTLTFVFAFYRFTFIGECEYSLWVLLFPEKRHQTVSRIFFLILTFSQENICGYTSYIFLLPPVYDTMLCVVHLCSKFCAVLVIHRQTDRDIMMQHNEQVRKELKKICDFDF